MVNTIRTNNDRLWGRKEIPLIDTVKSESSMEERSIFQKLIQQGIIKEKPNSTSPDRKKYLLVVSEVIKKVEKNSHEANMIVDLVKKYYIDGGRDDYVKFFREYLDVHN